MVHKNHLSFIASFFSPDIRYASQTQSKRRKNGGLRKWEWDENHACDFYYIITFKKNGERVRPYDKILLKNETSFEFPDIVDKVVVLVLVRTNENENHDHKFVTIKKANGNEFLMVIDLLSMVQQDREPKRRCQVYFGFLARSHQPIENSARVALKQELLKNAHDESKRTPKDVEEQIDIAKKAGGQYTMKYLASTNIGNESDVWMAMELCCMETLDVLIMMKKKDQSYVVDDTAMKILIRHVLLGLSYLHSQSIVHREMVMENMLISLDHKWLKIGDYDHVKQLRQGTMKKNPGDDIPMTASMFLACLRRKGKANSKAETKNTSQDWLKYFQESIPKQKLSEITRICNAMFPNLKEGTIDKSFEGTHLSPRISFPLILRGLAKFIWNTDDEKQCTSDQYLAAYFIIYMSLDCEKADDALKHPYFWDVHELFDFIGQTQDYLFTEQTCDLQNTVSRVKMQFKRFCDEIWPDMNWMEDIRSSMKEARKQNGKSESAMKNVENNVNSCVKKYGPSDAVGLLRAIRNIRTHHFQADEKWFESSSEIWRFFSDLFPELICLLHRAVWEQIKLKRKFPDYVQRFFDGHNCRPPLNIPDFESI